jgi:hypothetical protein
MGNTLVLIRRWSMEGARSDLDGHFASPVDIHAAVAALNEEPRNETPPSAPASQVLMKPAGEDEWRPLLVDVSNAA